MQSDWKNTYFQQSYGHFRSHLRRAPDRSAIILTDLAGRTVKFRWVRGVVGSNPADTQTFQIGLYNRLSSPFEMAIWSITLILKLLLPYA